jgi:hypothetical protein
MQHTNKTPLTTEQLRDASAAIFAKRPSKRVSERYGFVSTADIVKTMHAAGFAPFAARGQRSYKGGDNHLYGRHMVVFQPASGRALLGEVVPTVTVYNSHNGRTLYRLIAGLFRLVCSNGLMVAYRNFGSVEVRHNAGALDEIGKASQTVLAQARESIDTVQQMQRFKLDDKDQLTYARAALKLRYADAAPIKPEALLEVKRPEDEGRDLWHVFNRVQEHLMRGGLQGQASTGRRLTLRPITNIRREVTVNMDLWDMTMTYMTKHGHAPKLAA